MVYPNPAFNTGKVSIHLAPCDQTVSLELKVFTTAFRKVVDKPFPNGIPSGTCPLELKDDWGVSLANGLYYVVIDVPEGRAIEKLLILR